MNAQNMARLAFLTLWLLPWVVQADFKPAIACLALDRDRVQPGGTLQATYTFRSGGPSPAELDVFVHVVRPDGRHIGADFSPDLPTTEWPKSGFVREGPFPIIVPEDAAPGKYQVWVGMFSPKGGDRIAFDNADRARGAREYHAGEFEVVTAGSTAAVKPALFNWLPVEEARVSAAPAKTMPAGPAVLTNLALSVDRKVLHPVREPGASARLTLTGFYADGSQRVMKQTNAVIKARSRNASGNVEVVAIEGDRVVPKEGGIATVEATVVQGGRRLKAATDVVVAPFYRDYHQTLVMKLFLGMEGDPVERLAREPMFQKPHDGLCTFEEALEVIRKADNLTRGIPKIVYLVGWQKGGHDHGYPAWSEVNPRLKRTQDATPLESLRWLIREARKCNTTVSLHINMVDAYRQSPLWDEYVAKECFAKDASGRLLVAGIQMKGEEMYNVVYPKEWEAGLAQRRIDGLIRMIPELKEGHTIHIDVFVANRDGGAPISPWHAKPENGGLTPDKYVETQRKIFKYWRERGFDVTGEGIFWAHPPGEGFTGLQAMSWWYPGDAGYQMSIPECLMARGRTDRGGDGDFRFGSSMHGEEIWQRDKERMPGFQGMFCRTTLPWYYLSRLERLKFENGALSYSDGVVARTEMGKRIIRKGEFVLRENDDLFVPALWHKQEIIAYSGSGYENKSWRLPDDWKDVRRVDLYKITLEACVPLQQGVPVTDGKLVLSLKSGESISIVPAGAKLSAADAASPPASDPTKPDRGNEEWRMRHGERVADVRSHGNALDVLFIGDSITGGWRNIGKAIWEKEFVPLHAVNIGIAGSQTSHVLYQFENGAIDTINPRVAVLMIGVNNVVAAPSQSAADIARGVSTIVARLREKLPRTKVLLLGTFPKDRSPGTPDRLKIQEINSLIAKLDDRQWIRFLDMSGRLLDKDGNLTTGVSSDGVHLTPRGYQIWAEAIRPVLREMMAAANSRASDPVPGASTALSDLKAVFTDGTLRAGANPSADAPIAPKLRAAEWQPVPGHMMTRWAREVDPAKPHPEHPRPQLVRQAWQNLNGLWQFEINGKEAPQPTQFSRQVLVPYPVESALSGVKKRVELKDRLWYRRSFTVPEAGRNGRELLHFTAVDWSTEVFVNGQQVDRHDGGYDPFEFDITDALKPGGEQTLAVSVWDPSNQGGQPHGKQTLYKQGIFYTSSSGIWGTVWLEAVPKSYGKGIKLAPDIDAGVLRLTVQADAGRVRAVARDGQATVGEASGKAGEEIALRVPNAKLWTPDTPFHYDLDISLTDGAARDTVQSYFGMRKISIGPDEKGVTRILLNNKGASINNIYNLT
jgi:lysophospholipase L1-like esterase